MNNTLHVVDYAIILTLLGVTLSFGLYFSRRKQTTENFFLAKGRVPSWALGLSLLATLVSSITFLAYPGTGFSSNWILLVQGLMVPVVLVGVIWFIVPLYRKAIRLSTYEYFEYRFGTVARYYSSIAFVLRQLAGMGSVLFLLALAIHGMTGFSTTTVILVVGLTIMTINLLGGIEAVIWLDVFQGFMLFATGILCFGVLLFSLDGGFAEWWAVASAAGRTGFGPYDMDFTKLTFIVMAINGVFYAVQKYGTDQTVVQRYLTAKDDKSAIKASMIGILLTVPVWVLFMLIGTALFVFYQSRELPEGIKADAVFPYFIMTELPPGVVGLILAAMISAAICSLSADLNSLAAVGVEDYYKKLRKARSDREYLWAGKSIVLVSGMLSILIGLIYVRAGGEGILGTVFTLYAIFSGGIVGIFLLGLFSPRTNRQGVTIGIIACVLFTAYAVLTSLHYEVDGHNVLLLDLGQYNFVHDKLMLGVYSHLVLIGVGYFASLFFPKPVIAQSLLYSGWVAGRRVKSQ